MKMDLKKVIVSINAVMLLLCSRHIQCVETNSRVNSVNDINNENSDIYLDSLQLITKYNYSSEKHSVTTEDGYILNLFRIPRKGLPVLIVHGIGDSSDSWLVLGPKNSMAYLLADFEFDIWLFNARGNKYSLDHIDNLPTKQYWNFSYEEIGYYDLPAAIDYILLNTSNHKLSYIGFSQGATVFFVMCSLKPEYNAKVKQSVLLAPVAWLNRLKYPFIQVLTRNLEELTKLAQSIGLYDVFRPNPILSLYHATVCRHGNPKKKLCNIEYYLNYGLNNLNNLPKNRLPVIASHIPAGSSIKTFVHFMQGYASKRFQRFDYGMRRNLAMYTSSQPPEYDVFKSTIPTTLFVSEADWFSNPKDVDILKNMLPNVINYVILNKSLDFTHIEFVYGSRVKTIINQPVINVLLQNNV